MAEGATHSDRLLQGPDESMCGCERATVRNCVWMSVRASAGGKKVTEELEWVNFKRSSSV